MTSADAARIADACERRGTKCEISGRPDECCLGPFPTDPSSWCDGCWNRRLSAHFRTLASSPADSELADTFEKMIGRSDRSVIIPRGFANDVLAALRAKPTVAADSAEDAAGVADEIRTMVHAFPPEDERRDAVRALANKVEGLLRSSAAVAEAVPQPVLDAIRKWGEACIAEDDPAPCKERNRNQARRRTFQIAARRAVTEWLRARSARAASGEKEGGR